MPIAASKRQERKRPSTAPSVADARASATTSSIVTLDTGTAIDLRNRAGDAPGDRVQISRSPQQERDRSKPELCRALRERDGGSSIALPRVSATPTIEIDA
jgi:hypothetical protein